MLAKTESACFVIADYPATPTSCPASNSTMPRTLLPTSWTCWSGAASAVPPRQVRRRRGFRLRACREGRWSAPGGWIEQAYFAFRKRLAASSRPALASARPAAGCRAWTSSSWFIMGSSSGKRCRAARSRGAGRDPGPPAPQNEVGKTFGPHAYALYSDACVQSLGIDPAAQGLQGHAEAIEHIGETKCWVSDLEEAWTQEIETARTLVQRADALLLIERDFAAPRQALWDLSPRLSTTHAGTEATASSRPLRRDVVAPARRTTASTARTRSSRTSLTGTVRLCDFDGAAADPGRPRKSCSPIRSRNATTAGPTSNSASRSRSRGSALLRASQAHGRGGLYGWVRYPAYNGGGTSGGFDGRGRAASARFARALRDAAAPYALAGGSESNSV